jgi:muconolactone delta-isomerase
MQRRAALRAQAAPKPGDISTGSGPTALVVEVPDAEPLVADLRERHDPSAAAGVPAHVTVLVPFVPLAVFDAAASDRLAAVLAGTPTFDFTLARVGRFECVAWLAPEPAAPFVALTLAVLRAFPDRLPYGGAFDTIVPHLTAADADPEVAEAVAAELAQRLQRQGPVRARCTAVDLLENRGPDPQAARWHRVHRFVLPGPPIPAA